MKELLILLVAILFIVLLNTFLCRENFTVEESIKKKITLYIFLTNNCIYCKEFEKNKYDELVKQLGDRFDIKKIHLDNNRDLFMKYNIEKVPTAILENDDKTVVVKELTKESILKAYEEMENNNYHITYNNNYQESINNNKKDLLIFVSKNCPHCINYLKNSHDKLTNLLHNDCNIKLIFDDQDNNDLFSKYKIDFVPKAIILAENKEYIVNGDINYDNIKKTLNKEYEYNNENKYNKNEENNNKKKILVFLSKKCPHCIRYDNQTHDKLVNELGDKYNFKKIYEDDDKNEEIFMKYDIRYVPKLLIVDDSDNVKEINGELTSENILKRDNEIKPNIKEHMTNFNNQKKKLLVFLSKSCPHCLRYEKETHDILEKELGDFYNINKIHDGDKKNEEIFMKYDIKYVPKILIVDDNDKVIEIKGDFTPENIINQDIEKSLNIYDENIYNIIDDENIYDENNYNILEDEMLKNKKNHILIFLSKTCSKCLDYLQHIAPSVEKEFGKEFEVETIYIEDKSKIKYLKEFNIQNVPQAFVKYDNSMYFMVIPEVNNDNIKKTIKDIKGFNEKKKMDKKLNSETDFKNIMNLYSSIAYNNTDKNTNKNSDDTELLIFLTKKCNRCINYEKNIYPKLEKELLNKCKLRKLYYEDNKKIFEDYGVYHVPQCIISLKDKYIPIEESLAREFINKLFPGIFKNIKE